MPIPDVSKSLTRSVLEVGPAVNFPERIKPHCLMGCIASQRDSISGRSNTAAKARRARVRCRYGPVCWAGTQTSRGIGSKSDRIDRAVAVHLPPILLRIARRFAAGFLPVSTACASKKKLGRPKVSPKIESAIRQHLAAGHGILEVAALVRRGKRHWAASEGRWLGSQPECRNAGSS
jgi:hypothetical protein